MTTATETTNTEPNVGPNDVLTFRPYDPKMHYPEIPGFRQVKCMYKVDKKTGKKPHANSYIRIADYIHESSVQDNLTALMPYIVAFLKDQENGYIKSLHMAGKTKVAADDVSFDALVEYMEQNTASARLTKEDVEAWFAAKIEAPLIDAVSERLGVSEEPTEQELDKLAAIVETYKTKLSGLAGGRTVYRAEEAERLQAALVRAGVATGDVIGSRFNDRLEKMKTATADDLLLAL